MAGRWGAGGTRQGQQGKFLPAVGSCLGSRWNPCSTTSWLWLNFEVSSSVKWEENQLQAPGRGGVERIQSQPACSNICGIIKALHSQKVDSHLPDSSLCPSWRALALYLPLISFLSGACWGGGGSAATSCADHTGFVSCGSGTSPHALPGATNRNWDSNSNLFQINRK